MYSTNGRSEPSYDTHSPLNCVYLDCIEEIGITNFSHNRCLSQMARVTVVQRIERILVDFQQVSGTSNCRVSAMGPLRNLGEQE